MRRASLPTGRRARRSSCRTGSPCCGCAQRFGGGGRGGALGEALDRSEATGERWSEAELLRWKGEALLRLGDRDRAEACLLRAVSVARGQGARMWELHAATSLARLWQDQGRRAEAHDRLAPVYGWFSEGFDTPDLREARALLDDLASAPPGS